MNFFKLFFFLFFLICLSLLLFSCGDDLNNTGKSSLTIKKSQVYVLFTLNVHDWVFQEKSIEIVKKTINLHEKYGVPIDIYLNDPVIHNFVENAPELIEKLKNSSVVTVSYHFRAPMPANSGFDNFGLKEMSDEELYETLLAYEEHRLDLETGEYLDEPGGYQYVKDVIGYAPVTVGSTSVAYTSNVLEKIYHEKGAKLGVVNLAETDLGDLKSYLYARPQHVEIKWYEQNKAYMHNDITAEQLVTEKLAEYDGDAEQIFMNIKMHENNYYTQYTPFWPVYWIDHTKSKPLSPPFNLLKGQEEIKLRTNEYTSSMWEFYESGLDYVTSNPDKFMTISTKDIVEMLNPK